MRIILFILAALVVGFLVWWFVLRAGPAPILKTYSISGDIKLINDCSGLGADNPVSIDITVRLWYKSDTVNSAIRKVENVALALQADGITSKGTYTVSDVPTNLTGQRWEIDFPDECSKIPCDAGDCVDRATNVRQPIAITGVNSIYDYTYGCTCISP